MIALSAVARHSRALCTDLAMGPLKITFSGGGQAPSEHRSGTLSTAGLSTSPLSLGLPHPKI